MDLEATGDQFEEQRKELSQKDRYRLEKGRIIEEIGDLEEIRHKLGLSQRKLCQLLLVDPSAWTRWLKSESGAPPHIYQALRWLVALRKENADGSLALSLDERIDLVQAKAQKEITQLQGQLESLERSVGVAGQIYEVARDHQLEIEVLALKAQLKQLVEKQSPARKRKTPRKTSRKTTKKTAKKSAPQKGRKKALPKKKTLKKKAFKKKASGRSEIQKKASRKTKAKKVLKKRTSRKKVVRPRKLSAQKKVIRKKVRKAR